MAKKKKWIQAAGIKKGALTAQAKKEGFKTWQSFCNQPKEKLSPLARKRCNLARTLSGLS